ncbi:hypothetical protein Poly30_09220 [Planctomycetes bacterium Poly30]|uniref:Uncharacterized protein n=1 Tax=Saltatorellus ferox TaxID=2528018 RepID=A0A518EMW1_9BACT|nr:hypothetical protein Poly30_09220 [Planctomycetes bacterium Poly30]
MLKKALMGAAAGASALALLATSAIGTPSVPFSPG